MEKKLAEYKCDTNEAICLKLGLSHASSYLALCVNSFVLGCGDSSYLHCILLFGKWCFKCFIYILQYLIC